MRIIKDKYRIYIISYNSNTKTIANNYFNNKPWAKIIEVKTSPYFENILYDNWLLSDINDWLQMDYVGSLSWRSYQKIQIPKLENYELNLNITQKNPDVVCYLPFFRKNLLSQAKRQQGSLFKKVWIYLLTELGYSEKEATDPSIKLFMCNYWMAKPEIMIEYIHFFQKVKNKIENSDTDIKNDIYSNSNYTGYLSEEKLLEIFGKPYYPLYLFILERLPCFFFHHRGYKVLSYGELNESNKSY